MRCSEDYVAFKSQSSQGREHEESYPSNSSGFSGRPPTEPETSFSSEPTEGPDQDLTDVKVNAEDSFILMFGFLNKVKNYFDERNDSVAKSLNEELKILQRVLLNSAESFGYDVEDYYEPVKSKKAGPTKQSRKNDTHSKQTPPDKTNGNEEMDSDPGKPMRRKSTRQRNLAKNNKNKGTAVEKTKQATPSRKRKITNEDGVNCRVSKRVKGRVCGDKLSQTVARLKQRSSMKSQVGL